MIAQLVWADTVQILNTNRAMKVSQLNSIILNKQTQSTAGSSYFQNLKELLGFMKEPAKNRPDTQRGFAHFSIGFQFTW